MPASYTGISFSCPTNFSHRIRDEFHLRYEQDFHFLCFTNVNEFAVFTCIVHRIFLKMHDRIISQFDDNLPARHTGICFKCSIDEYHNSTNFYLLDTQDFHFYFSNFHNNFATNFLHTAFSYGCPTNFSHIYSRRYIFICRVVAINSIYLMFPFVDLTLHQ